MKPLLIMVLLVVWSMAVSAERFPELTTAYSADFSQIAADVEMVGKVWVDGDRQRVESMMDGERLVSIAQKDTGTVYIFTVGEASALAVDYTPEMVVTHETYQALNPVFEARETIRGETALRFAIEGETAFGFSTSGKIWITRDGILLRTETETVMGEEWIRGITEQTNIKRGPIETSLFELPQGLRVERH